MQPCHTSKDCDDTKPIDDQIYGTIVQLLALMVVEGCVSLPVSSCWTVNNYRPDQSGLGLEEFGAEDRFTFRQDSWETSHPHPLAQSHLSWL